MNRLKTLKKNLERNYNMYNWYLILERKVVKKWRGNGIHF